MAAVKSRRSSSTDEVADYLEVDNFGVRSSRVLTSISFSNLPREIQLYIFSFLTHEELCKSVAPVCHEWWILSKDPSLWKSLTIFFYRSQKAKFLRLLERCSRMLVKLKIRTSCPLNDFAAASHACPMLKCLDLGKVNLHVNRQIVPLFVQNCPLIEELNLKRCAVNKGSVRAIVRLKHLRVLNLSRCSELNDNLIQLISENCTRLEDFNICNTDEVTDKAISKVIENLQSILTRLALGGCTNTADSAFAKIGLCTKLQHLSICEFNIFGCGTLLTDQTFIDLKMLLGLKSLTLEDAWTDDSLTFAVNNFFAGAHVNSLEKLVLGGFCINDEGVYNITQNCKSLKSLYLHQGLKACRSKTIEVTEVGFEHIVKHCSNLTYLHLSRLDLLTGRCLQLIPENLSYLEFMKLDSCKGIVKSVVNDLASRVPKLKIEFQK